MAKQKKTAKSPYCKYQKKPYIYSQLLQNWTAAVKAGKRDEANRLGREHSKVWGTAVSEDYNQR